MKDNSELKVKYLSYFRALPIQKLAAAHVGKSEDTVIRWKKDDEEFANQVNEAMSAWAKEKAQGVKSKEWLLERVMNDHFGQKTKTDITSGGKELEALTVVKNANDKSIEVAN